VAKLEDWASMYAQLWRIRWFESHVQRLAAKGEIAGFPHLSTGQEAVAVGVCAHLRKDDTLYTSHRGHGHVLAKGSDVQATFAEILGREEGLCKGRGGSMHLVDAANGVLGATGVVGGNLPLAAGSAWAAQSQGLSSISAVFFGDGATGAGVFHETMNLAALWKLPILFVCENNGVAEFTTRDEHSNVDFVSAFAEPYAIATKTIDGNFLPTVLEAAEEAIASIRAGNGPYLLECMTYRLAGHYVGDSQQYRTKEELAEMREKCPIERLRRHLLENGVSDDDLKAVADQVEQEVEAAVTAAQKGKRADPATVMDYVYSTPAMQGLRG